MKELIGKTLNGISVFTSDNDSRVKGDGIIVFTDDSEEKYVCYGDCCSNSFVSEVQPSYGHDIWKIYGNKITDVIEMDLHECEVSPTLQEEDQVYGYELVTEKGSIFITYRNSSNGYYGGWIEKADKAEVKNKVDVSTRYFSPHI